MLATVYNTAQTLLDLGFEHYPEWDYGPAGSFGYTEHYRLVTPHATFRAYEQRHNGPVYVRLGRVVNKAGQVCAWGWMDCESNGSVARKVAVPAEDAPAPYCCAYCARRAVQKTNAPL